MKEQELEEIERFKKSLIDSLENIQKNTKTETIRIDKIITIIKNTN